MLMFRNRVFRLFRPAKGVNLLMIRNSVFRLRNVKIWTVPSFKAVDLLMLRNGFFRQRDVRFGQCQPASGRNADAQESHIILRNVQIWAVPSCKWVDVVMLRNYVFRMRNVYIPPSGRLHYL